jgi:hypothetical protein
MTAIDRNTGSMTGTRVHAFTDDDALGRDDVEAAQPFARIDA